MSDGSSRVKRVFVPSGKLKNDNEGHCCCTCCYNGNIDTFGTLNINNQISDPFKREIVKTTKECFTDLNKNFL